MATNVDATAKIGPDRPEIPASDLERLEPVPFGRAVHRLADQHFLESGRRKASRLIDDFVVAVIASWDTIALLFDRR